MALVVLKNEPLERHTTFGIPGVAKEFVEVTTVEELKEAYRYAQDNQLELTVISGGSNLVCAPEVGGLVVKVAIKGRQIEGVRVVLGAGESLLETVHAVNAAGLRGLESLAGIPGTVGGAVVGNAGAYGTEIGSRVVAIEVFDGEELLVYSREECEFEYRNSVFKENRSLVVLRVTLDLLEGDAKALSETSADIIKKRLEKYPPTLRCPGSFFKNQLQSEVDPEALALLPPRALVYDKVAVGYLIESVGGRGLCVGGACVAEYHGNLLVNTGSATYRDVRSLADMLREKVKERFGVELKEEIRYIG